MKSTSLDFRMEVTFGSSTQIVQIVFPFKSFCERSPPGLSHLNCRTFRHRTPLREGDRSGNDSQLVPVFKSLFQDVLWTVPERGRTCWFKKSSSNLNRAPKMRDSVLLKSWDSFLVTVPSFSLETCVMYSSVIPGTDVFCDWLFRECSCVSLKQLLTFSCFFMLPTFWREKAQQCWRLNFSINFKWIL